MKSSHKKLVGLLILLLFLVPLGVAGKKVYLELRQPELNRVLIAAVKKNDTTAVVALLAQGADPNAGDLPPEHRSVWLKLWDRLRRKPFLVSDGQTAMSAAVAPRFIGEDYVYPPENVPLMKALLNAGGDVNVSEDYMTPLFWAAIDAKRETVRLLLDRGADVRATSKDHHMALHYAVLQRDPVVVKMLLDRGAQVDARNGVGATPLHLAAEAGRVVNMRLLIARGANVNARQADMSTPLALAAKYNEPECVKLLLLSGAQANARDGIGHTPLWLAKDARWKLVRNDTRQIVKMLKKAGAKE